MDSHHERVVALKAGIEAKIKAYDDENQERLDRMDKKLKLMESKQSDARPLQGIEERIEAWKKKIEEVMSTMNTQITQLRERQKEGSQNYLPPTSETQKNFTLNMNQDMFSDPLAEHITGISQSPHTILHHSNIQHPRAPTAQAKLQKDGLSTRSRSPKPAKKTLYRSRSIMDQTNPTTMEMQPTLDDKDEHRITCDRHQRHVIDFNKHIRTKSQLSRSSASNISRKSRLATDKDQF